MLIVCKYLKHCIYDDIQKNIKSIYGIDSSYYEDIIMNAIPIKNDDNYYIFANLAKLEISSLELNKQSYSIEYIIDKEFTGTIQINNVISVHDITTKKNPKDGDCFYDEHLNIMFIKFRDIHIEYIDITDYNINEFDKINNINCSITWLNNFFENKIIYSRNNKIIFQDDFIKLPPVPFLLSETQLIDDLTENDMVNYPITGSKVFDDSGNFIGMVSSVDKEHILTIPLILLKRAIKYVNNCSMKTFKLDADPIKIYYNDIEMNDKCINGLYCKNKEKKKYHFNKYCIIISIDGFTISSSGKIQFGKVEVPLITYFWLFKLNNISKIKSIDDRMIENSRICKLDNDLSIYCRNEGTLMYKQHEIKLKKQSSNSLSVSDLNYIKYKNKIMLEMNEKIMQILKPIMQTTDHLDYLYDYIISKKTYSDKIIVIIDNRLNIKIVNKINNTKLKNIDNVFKHFKTQKEMRNFIENF